MARLTIVQHRLRPEPGPTKMSSSGWRLRDRLGNEICRADEVGYAFARAAWGLGYATELVQFSLTYAFGVLAALEVHAYAKPANTASHRVLGKCGFNLLRYEPSLERNHYLRSAPK